jgi:hypothetical protein
VIKEWFGGPAGIQVVGRPLRDSIARRPAVREAKKGKASAGNLCAVRDERTDDCTGDEAENTYTDGRRVKVQRRIKPEVTPESTGSTTDSCLATAK